MTQKKSVKRQVKENGGSNILSISTKIFLEICGLVALVPPKIILTALATHIFQINRSASQTGQDPSVSTKIPSHKCSRNRDTNPNNQISNLIF